MLRQEHMGPATHLTRPTNRDADMEARLSSRGKAREAGAFATKGSLKSWKSDQSDSKLFIYHSVSEPLDYRHDPMTFPYEAFQLEEIAPSAWQRHLVLSNGSMTLPYANRAFAEGHSSLQEMASDHYVSEV